MPSVEANGVELFYERTGSGERVVLTHGAWTDGRTWLAVVERLADRFETVMWDRRGHSRSQNGEGRGSVQEDAADLAALIQHLGSETVHLVGNSAGGNVVLNLLTMRPDLVKTAAVHEPGPFGLLEGSADDHLVQVMEEDKVRTTHVVDLIAGGRHREAARYFVDEIAVGPGAWEQFPEQLRDVMESNAPTVPDDIRDGWDADSVDIEALSTSVVPLLVSTGSSSPELESGAAHMLARRVPRARLETLAGAGHIPHRTHTDAYVELLAGFIGATPGNGRGS